MDSHSSRNNGVRPASINSQGGGGRLGGVSQQERESSHLPFGEAKHREGSKGQRCGRVAASAWLEVISGYRRPWLVKLQFEGTWGDVEGEGLLIASLQCEDWFWARREQTSQSVDGCLRTFHVRRGVVWYSVNKTSKCYMFCEHHVPGFFIWPSSDERIDYPSDYPHIDAYRGMQN